MTTDTAAPARPGVVVSDDIFASDISVFDMFTLGIGPSSSHTVGPMVAARQAVDAVVARGQLARTTSVTVNLYGSLAATGVGHGTPDAVIAGLAGLDPQTCDPAAVRGRWAALDHDPTVDLAGIHPIAMTGADIAFLPQQRQPLHTNAVEIVFRDCLGATLYRDLAYSIGGGFVVRAGDRHRHTHRGAWRAFNTAGDLLAACATEGVDIAELAVRNEINCADEPAEIARQHGHERLDRIATAMRECVEAGLRTTGVLPGPLQVPRRATGIARSLERDTSGRDRSSEWLQAFAIAVNEENAAGNRIVTAPTNGAAGIVPAVLYYAQRFLGAGAEQIRTYLLTAGIIGTIIKRNASISGAELGCQGEVGSACAMAAAGLCALLGGSTAQIENAAEIAIEHHLGLTCDPVGGLVQIPCIERNGMASVTAMSAARLALHGTGQHHVSLDIVIETMRQTGNDMSDRYKETSTGGLAVNVVEC
ncbi:L-serine ammonia-lyase [Mycolicibacterium sp. 22603]|uniref:L-serine ammonia-lyase n=1 Tax=Mycolicibacterium sp. 22603 TaxID=3453950 RepID=UPI003F855834